MAILIDGCLQRNLIQLFLILLFHQLFFAEIPISAENLNSAVTRINLSAMAEWIEDSSETVLRLKYPKGCVGTSKKNGCAVQFSLPLDELNADELWCSYEVYFEKNFDFRNGGKLPGFCGGKCYTGGNKPTDADGWSNRIMWKKDGFLTQYVYYYGQKGRYADNFKWDLNGKISQKKITTGKWHKILMRVKLNDVDFENKILANGILQTWFDGELVVDLDSMLFRNRSELKIDRFYFSTFHGGNDKSFAPRWDSFIRFRNLQIFEKH